MKTAVGHLLKIISLLSVHSINTNLSAKCSVIFETNDDMHSAITVVECSIFCLSEAE